MQFLLLRLSLYWNFYILDYWSWGLFMYYLLFSCLICSFLFSIVDLRKANILWELKHFHTYWFFHCQFSSIHPLYILRSTINFLNWIVITHFFIWLKLLNLWIILIIPIWIFIFYWLFLCSILIELKLFSHFHKLILLL